MSNLVTDNEKVATDNGYKHHQSVIPGDVSDRGKAAHALLRARHKTFYNCLQNFNILKDAFRYRLQLHKHAFCIVAKLSTWMVRNKFPSFFVQMVFINVVFRLFIFELFYENLNTMKYLLVESSGICHKLYLPLTIFVNLLYFDIFQSHINI